MAARVALRFFFLHFNGHGVLDGLGLVVNLATFDWYLAEWNTRYSVYIAVLADMERVA